ncbi:MAG: leucine--tRNA ligase [Alphaproteobacteria bacterium]|jgi:leucyl-tRNA synthetase|nr:leucine--tRNA ligase [Alphaproteobacteria bacterium]
MEYNFNDIEKKWQKKWSEAKSFEVKEIADKEKFYCLLEFPFPSGSGLHVGHVRPYTAMDVVARKKRMEGKNVLFPMGFDSFGMQAEQYAIKTGGHPREITEENCSTYKKQLENLGLSFDWSREIATSRTGYYKWTQWMFLQFFKQGLAYKAEDTMNWCPACKLALTNEELEKGKCERCGGDVIQKTKSQWTLRMKDYSQKLIDGLDHVDYTDNIKKQQINWIGKSVGANVDFKLSAGDDKLTVFTTRPDTIFGVSFMVVAPEHPMLEKFSGEISNYSDVEAYKVASNKKTEMERMEGKEKSGVKLEGVFAINPFNGKEVPIFVSDYVMMGYGTGAVMAVPAHDQRDYEFAKKFGCEIVQVIEGGDIEVEAYAGDGKHINSGFMDGLGKQDSINSAIKFCEENSCGEKAVNYKMKDWLFSRQRYWGEPVPMVYCETCKKVHEAEGRENAGWVALPESELPLELPHIDNYLPTDEGDAPLARAEEWVNCKCPVCGGAATRETDTMPNWAGSSWYYLRYMDANNSEEFAAQDKVNYWGQVDLYCGGQEHTTRHLLYARFWHKALYDAGIVSYDEPFSSRISQGLIGGEDGQKMSKSKGNVVNPDDIVGEYGADTLRAYEAFIAPFADDVPWNTSSMIGVHRFLQKVWRYADRTEDRPMNEVEEKALHRSIKEVGERIDTQRFNTVVSSLMECLNALPSEGDISADFMKGFVKVLNPVAPHISEEIWEKLGGDNFLVFEAWPSYDESKLVESTVSIAVSVNGKKRDVISIAADASKDEMEKLALASDNVQKFIEGKDIVKVIVVPGKMVNFVIK